MSGVEVINYSVELPSPLTNYLVSNLNRRGLTVSYNEINSCLNMLGVNDTDYSSFINSFNEFFTPQGKKPISSAYDTLDIILKMMNLSIIDEPLTPLPVKK